MMKHYEKLLAKGSFSREQLIEIVGTATAANQVIYEYQKKGLIEKVKRDFYVVISMETKQPVSFIKKSIYISCARHSVLTTAHYSGLFSSL